MDYSLLIILFAIIGVLFIVLYGLWQWSKKKKLVDYASNITSRQEVFTPSEFFHMYSDLKKMKIKISELDASGVYIIFNISKQSYYVGQSINVLKRVNNHFTGSGNGDVYADYKYGSQFQITIVKCEQSKLNAMERYFIER
ncbi:MAG: GIY-YIG nuclease family protein, partial [Malacoplasma sp.]